MGHTSELADLLERLRRGDPDARCRVIECAVDRLRTLASKMMRSNPRVRRWAETDDLLQGALLRLHRCMAELHPEGVRQFYALAGLQIRRELLDLAKHYQGAHGVGANHKSDGGRAAQRQCADPLESETLDAWTRFHEHVGCLPDDEREVVQLVWYDGMKQPEAAGVLGVSLATLKRRWQSARLRMSELLEDWSVE
jgi:RNA polymerase sigma-70 factor (ECF subfamily)